MTAGSENPLSVDAAVSFLGLSGLHLGASVIGLTKEKVGMNQAM